MKKIVQILICIIVTINTNAQVSISFDFSSEEDNRLIKENDSVKFYVASGDTNNIVCINEETSYYRLLNKDNRVIAEGAFVMEGDKYLQEGKWIENYESGKLKLTGSFKKNKPIGCWTEYYQNGKVKNISNYAIITDADGLISCLSGTYQEFYKTGQIKVSGFYAAELFKIKDTLNVDDPVSGKTVAKIRTHNALKSEKFGHWEYYTETGELDKKQDY